MHQPAVSSTGTELFERRASGPRSERYRAQVDGAQVELRVVKKPFAVDTAGFVSRTEALAQLSHPSLRMVRGATVLSDGRPAAVLSLVDWVPLSACPKQATGPLLTMAIELSEGLAALHSAGLVMGVLDADDIYPGQPAVLDASLAGLSQGGDTPQEDVKMLSLSLLGVVGGGKEAAPIELILKKARAESMSAEALARDLNALRTRWAARTVSGNFAVLPETIEVMEPDLTGRTLKHWKLEAVIGEGAMACVYQATDTRDGSTAAVKVLKQEHVAEPEFVQRFIQEVKAVEAVHNPHIVKVTDFGDESFGANQRVVFCVMEVLQGQALADAMMKEAFGVERIAKLAQQTARCLHAAHQVGIIHRDIKPENLFLTQQDGAEFVKVLDFGIAKLLKQIGDLPRVGTKAGVVVGTPEYMAPEQALGGEADARIDVYAVGLIMYELLSGEQPFKGDTFGKLVLEITQNAVPPLPAETRSGERMPPELSAVVLKCLEKVPDDRFPNAAALADALEPFCAGGAAGLKPFANPRRLTGGRSQVARFNEAAEPPPQVTEAELEAAVKPSKVPLIVAGVVFGLLTLGAVAVFKSGSASDQPVTQPEKGDKPANDVAPPKPPEVVKKVAPPPEEPPKPALPAKVKVMVTSTPRGASVKRDKELLGKTPVELEFDRADRPQALSIELAGYVAQTREVDLTADGKFEVALEKVSKKKKPPPKKKPKK